jgi:hypothetical protein
LSVQQPVAKAPLLFSVQRDGGDDGATFCNVQAEAAAAARAELSQRAALKQSQSTLPKTTPSAAAVFTGLAVSSLSSAFPLALLRRALATALQPLQLDLAPLLQRVLVHQVALLQRRRVVRRHARADQRL